MIDTHTHLYLPEFDADREHVMQRAFDAGVTYMVFPNIDSSTIAPMLDTYEKWADHIFPAMGLHPTSVKEDWREELDIILDELIKHRELYSALGEVGMDLYWDKTYREEQKEVLRKQLYMAKTLTLPALIHCREALDDTLEVIREVDFREPVVFHSFTGTVDDVKRIRDTVADPWFGINGVVTFKNATALREAVKEIELGRILTETDSPYLAPVPYRGKRNESSFLPLVINKLAEVLDFDEGFVEYFTTINFMNAFRLGPKGDAPEAPAAPDSN